MKTITILPQEPYKYDMPHVIIHDDELPHREAELASVLVEKWGLVAAEPDGEDSSGRSKLRLQTPAELVNRAFETAKLFMDEARKRNLLLKVGPLPEPTLREPRKPKET